MDGKRAVITGGGSGIGRATAVLLASRGVRVALLDVSQEGLAGTRALLDGDGHHSSICNVSSPEAVGAAFSQAEVALGGLDILINNAGINPPVASSLDVTADYYDLMMGVNAKGMFFSAQAALRAMVPRRTGVIVNLGSVSGLIGWGGSSVYCASKGAVIALTRALATEFASYGIRVNAVAPGSVRTPMVENNFRHLGDPDAAWQRTAELHPLGRPAEASEIAEAIVYLASPSSSFVSGTVLTIDGGLTAQ